MKSHDVLAIAMAFVCGGCAHSYSPPTPTYYSVATFDPLDAIGVSDAEARGLQGDGTTE